MHNEVVSLRRPSSSVKTAFFANLGYVIAVDHRPFFEVSLSEFYVVWRMLKKLNEETDFWLWVICFSSGLVSWVGWLPWLLAYLGGWRLTLLLPLGGSPSLVV